VIFLQEMGKRGRTKTAFNDRARYNFPVHCSNKIPVAASFNEQENADGRCRSLFLETAEMLTGKGIRKSPGEKPGLSKYFAFQKSKAYFFLAAFFLAAFLGAAFLAAAFFGAAFFAAFFFVAIFLKFNWLVNNT